MTPEAMVGNRRGPRASRLQLPPAVSDGWRRGRIDGPAVADLGRQAWAAVGILRAEWRNRRLVRLPLGQRLACLRLGFNTRSLLSYGASLPPAAGLYVSDWREAALSKRPNRAYSAMLDDKLLFWLAMARLSPHVAPLLGFIRNGNYHPMSENGSSEPVVSLLDRLSAPLVFKPVRGTLARGIYIAEPDGAGLRVNGKPMSKGVLAAAIGRQAYVVAPRIEPAPYARTIFPRSLNSIRVMTLIDPQTGSPFMPFVVHRFGADCSAPFDAFAHGGVSAPVDRETGRLGQAVRWRPSEGRQHLEVHPDTGAPITGVVIPGWASIRDHLLELASRLHYLPYIGWDIVLTDGGFLINEGNSRPSLRIPQAAIGPILTDDSVLRFYQHYGIVSA
jgi:hypothetical protein